MPPARCGSTRRAAPGRRRSWRRPGSPSRRCRAIVEGSEPAGAVLPAWRPSSACRRASRSPAGAGDAAAGAIGIGAIEDGDAFVSLGTSAQYFVTTAGYRPYPERLLHAFCHGLPGRWYQMRRDAQRRQLPRLGRRPARRARHRGPARPGRGAPCGPVAAPVPALSRRRAHAARRPACARRPVRPRPRHRRGRRRPGGDGGRRLLAGRGAGLPRRRGHRARRLAAIGGGARSPFWMRLLATVLDRPVTLYAGAAKGPAFGAARLARLAVTGEPPEPSARSPKVAEVLEPEPRLIAAYAARGQRFRALYRALRPEFPAAAAR